MTAAEVWLGNRSWYRGFSSKTALRFSFNFVTTSSPNFRRAGAGVLRFSARNEKDGRRQNRSG
jgi:hypothetical protein